MLALGFSSDCDFSEPKFNACAAQPDDFQQSAKKKNRGSRSSLKDSRRTRSEEQFEPLAEVSFSSVTMALTLAKMTTGVNLDSDGSI